MPLDGGVEPLPEVGVLDGLLVRVEGLVRLSSARIAAISSIRLFVVPALSPPQISLVCEPYLSTAPQPPGPGLPLHAPSV